MPLLEVGLGIPVDLFVQFMPNTTEQDLEENGAGITTIMNIGYVHRESFLYFLEITRATATSRISQLHIFTII